MPIVVHGKIGSFWNAMHNLTNLLMQTGFKALSFIAASILNMPAHKYLWMLFSVTEYLFCCVWQFDKKQTRTSSTRMQVAAK